MAEYIEREAALEMCGWYNTVNGKSVCAVRKDELAAIPAADVAPVVHGYWIPSESDFDDDDTLFDVEDWCDWQCSACHTDICYEDPMERRFLPKFCPNCGARMDGE